MADVLIIDDQDRYTELCRRTMPEHEYHGPARSWSEAKALLKRIGRRIDVVLLDVHFDIPPEDLLGLAEDADDLEEEILKESAGAPGFAPVVVGSS